jgi:hypothetical protein
VFGSCVQACFDPSGCDNKSCGEDACGASCGACDEALPCGFGGVCNTCAVCGLTEADCLNLNVEEGGLLGWQLEGDARVVENLGETLPVEGDKMLLLSTGLGFTTQVGEATFANCLPDGEWYLAFKYKFYSRCQRPEARRSTPSP